MYGNPNRIGRRVYGDEVVRYTFDPRGFVQNHRIFKNGYTHSLRFENLIEFAYEYPRAVGWTWQTVNCWWKPDVIEWLTGYEAFRSRVSYRVWTHGEQDDVWLKPIHHSVGRFYYYHRDRLEVLASRGCRCVVCGNRLPMDKWVDGEYQLNLRFCKSELCSVTAQQAYKIATVGWGMRAKETREGLRAWFWREHGERAWPACSRECHDGAVRQIRDEIAQLGGMERWHRKRREQLRKLRSVVRQKHRERRGHAQSQSAESVPPVT